MDATDDVLTRGDDCEHRVAEAPRRSDYDVIVIGAGIVGLATARSLLRRAPELRLAVLEKESQIGAHQTSHNSGVIHAGLYYRPGTLRARMCVEGARRMLEFCEARGIPVLRCGKVVVATDEGELPALEEIYCRGTANGVQGLRRIDAVEIKNIEPHAAGIAAIHSPNTASVDFRAVAAAYVEDIRELGGELLLGCGALGFRSEAHGVRMVTPAGDMQTRVVVNCAGLYADVIARQMGASPTVRIVPFRGEYYYLRSERGELVRGLIYPVPNPELPFLGVHFTRTVKGEVEAGPNAVFAFAREGYSTWTANLPELIGAMSYPGFWRMGRRFWRTGISEFRRSLDKAQFVRSLQRLVPEVRADDLVRGGAGVRAQAVAVDGRLVDDFVIVRSDRAIHVLNAPSPAATASLEIGDHIADLAGESFTLCGT